MEIIRLDDGYYAAWSNLAVAIFLTITSGLAKSAWPWSLIVEGRAFISGTRGNVTIPAWD